MFDLALIENTYFKATHGMKDEWFETVGGRYGPFYEYVKSLSDDLRVTFLVVTVHYQVQNGGFHQYFLNSYGQFTEDTTEALTKIGANKKADLLKMAYEKVNIGGIEYNAFRIRLINGSIDALYEDELDEPLAELDKIYYANDEDIEMLLTAYLTNLYT